MGTLYIVAYKRQDAKYCGFAQKKLDTRQTKATQTKNRFNLGRCENPPEKNLNRPLEAALNSVLLGWQDGA